MKNYLLLLPIALVLLLSGCASVPMADNEHDRHAKTFSPKANLSNIYVYSESGVIGSKLTWMLTIDGQAVGGITNGNFIQLEVQPGSHTVYSFADSAPDVRAVSEVNMEAGKNYFFNQAIGMGFEKFKNNLHQVDEATGRKQVSKSKMVFIPENVIQLLAAAPRRIQYTVIQPSFASPDKIIAPPPIAGNSGKYMSPFTAAGAVALWAQQPAAEKDNGSDLAANVGSAIGQHIGNKVLENIPFGLGGMVGKQAGELAARTATRKNIEPELPSMDAVKASSDISFNSLDKLAVYMYVKNSNHIEYERALELIQRIYPELRQAYTPAIEKASQSIEDEEVAQVKASTHKSKKQKSADERLNALKKLKENGLISDTDYQTKKNRILEAL